MTTTEQKQPSTFGKVKVRRILKRWGVSCDECESGDFLRMMRPWALAGDHGTAMMLAHWHAREHDARRCDSCFRTDPLPNVDVIDKHHANYDGYLWEFTTGAPVRIGTAAS